MMVTTPLGFGLNAIDLVEDTITLFAGLVKTGLAWSTKGHHGLMEPALIEQGLITCEGEVC